MQFQHMNFFCTIGLRFNSLHLSYTSNLQPSSTYRQSQITRSQIFRSQEIFFFYARTKKKFPVGNKGNCKHQGGASSVGPERVIGVASVTSTTRSLECYPATSTLSRRRFKRERERRKKIHVFFWLKYTCVVYYELEIPSHPAHTHARGTTLRPRLVPKIFSFYSSHQIFRRMHRTLNVDEKN